MNYQYDESASFDSLDSLIMAPCERSILELPTEVLLHIFSLLSQEELSRNVKPVCRLWNELSSDPLLWKEIYLQAHHLIPENIYSVLHVLQNASTHLRELDCEHTTSGSQIIEVLSKNNPSLQKLRVRFTQLTSDHPIKMLLGFCSKLTELNLEGVRVSSLCEGDCCKDISGNNNLKLLNLSHCTWVNDKFLDALSDSSYELESLNIEGNHYISDEAIGKFIKLKGSFIRTLFVDGEQLSEQSFLSISRICTKLNKFSSFFSDRFTDSCLQSILHCENLTFLKLRKGVDISRIGFINAFASVRKLDRLTELDLSECDEMNDETCKLIAAKCPNLEFVGLDWCIEVTNRGIAAILNSSPNLIKLSLVGVVRINSTAFDTAHETCTKLRYLDLTQCSYVDDDQIEAIIKRNPLVSIRCYWGELYNALSLPVVNRS